MDYPNRVNSIICELNSIAGHDTVDFDELKKFAKSCPISFADVMVQYLNWPDSRFGDNLLVFCEGVKTGRITLS